MAQPHQLKNIRHPLANVLLLSADHPHGKGHIVIHRHLGDQAEVLEHNTHGAAIIGHLPLLQSGGGILVKDHLALRGLFLVHNEFQKGGLAGAGGAYHKHELAILNLNIHMIEGVGVRRVVHLRYISEFNHNFYLF